MERVQAAWVEEDLAAVEEGDGGAGVGEHDGRGVMGLWSLFEMPTARRSERVAGVG